MIPPESSHGLGGAGFSADAPAPSVPLPPHRARLWDFLAVAMLGAHTYWRRPELVGISQQRQAPTWWHRLVGAVLGALWGASMTWAGLVVLSPDRDVAVSFWLPWRWWQPPARLIAVQALLVPALLVPSLALWLVFDVDLVAGMTVTLVLVVLGAITMAGVDRRLHRGVAPTRLPGKVSITGLASRSGTPWGPSRFLRDELLPWAKEHNVGLYTAAASPAHARLYRGVGFVLALEHGPLALIRPARVPGPPGRQDALARQKKTSPKSAAT